MRGFIGKSLLVACGSLLVVSFAKADLFTQPQSTTTTIEHKSLKQEATEMINKQHQQSKTIGNNLKTLVNDTGLRPKDIINPAELPINQSDNAVWFYFTDKSFSAGNIYRAIDLAKKYNLVPVIYYLSNQCSFTNAQSVQHFFYDHGLQYIFTQQYQNINFELSCNAELLRKMNGMDRVYFKFMSNKGLHGSGYLDDFTKVYRSCFIH